MKAFTSFEQILETVQAEKPKSEFSAVVSNPPYQVNVGGESNSAKAYPVWQEFLMISSEISNRISFINPARWQKGGAGSGLTEIREWLSTNKHLKSFYNLNGEDTFPSTGIAGGVCIEFIDKTQEFLKPTFRRWSQEDGWTESVDYNFDNGLDIFVENPIDRKILASISKLPYDSVEDQKLHTMGQDEFTKKGSPVITSQDQNNFGIIPVRLKREPNYFRTSPYADCENVKIYNKELFSVEGSYRYIPRDEITKNTHRIDLIQAIFPKTGAERLYRATGIIREGETATYEFLGRDFDNTEEAEGFLSYLRTYFYRYLTSLRRVSLIAYANVHRWVPDIATLENPRTKKMGYLSDWTDDDLREAFGDLLTDDDWLHIKSTAISADGGRGDYENGYELPEPYGWAELHPRETWNGPRTSLSI